MAKKGWISVHRCITDNFIWQEKPFDKARAWIDLLLMANHTSKKIILGNQVIDVNPGEIITSELKLMERWGWGKSKLRAFLNILENEQMLVKKSDNKKTTLTIVNWLDYQDLETANRPQTDFKQTSSVQQTDTNNNVNNYKQCKTKRKNIKKEDRSLQDLILDWTKNPDLIKAFSDFAEMRASIKKPLTNNAAVLVMKKLDSWYKTIEDGINEKNKIKTLENSTLNSWQGVFELKPEQREKTQEEVFKGAMI